VNVVLHRANLDHIEAIIEMAAALGADRLELANTQYYGWATLNRAALMPTRAQVQQAEEVATRLAARYRGRMQIIYVLPDYFEPYPKACYAGWGSVYIVVGPDGRTLPCHAAGQISTLTFPNVRERSLAWIWDESPAFNAFRGDAWMPDPCRSCARKHVDFGGCRCQAFALTGDAARTDPVCTLSADRPLVDAALGAPAIEGDTNEGIGYRYRALAPARAARPVAGGGTLV
jgi:pyrroloquinoline quinone biosynthesis protein E